MERVEIKDVKLPHQLQRAMAAEAEAAREARAKVSAHARARSSRQPPFTRRPRLFAGDRGRGRDERVPRPEGGVPGDRGVPVGPAAPLPADAQHHRSGEELHHHLPAAHGRHFPLHAEVTPVRLSLAPSLWAL